MSEQQLQQQVNELNSKLVISQSKAFELMAQLTEEKNMANANTASWQGVVQKVSDILGLENPTIDAVYAAVNKLVKKGAK